MTSEKNKLLRRNQYIPLLAVATAAGMIVVVIVEGCAAARGRAARARILRRVASERATAAKFFRRVQKDSEKLERARVQSQGVGSAEVHIMLTDVQTMRRQPDC